MKQKASFKKKFYKSHKKLASGTSVSFNKNEDVKTKVWSLFFVLKLNFLYIVQTSIMIR